MRTQTLTKNHELLSIEVNRHIAADAVIQGSYFKQDSSLPTGGRGCFIGCLAHANEASLLQEKYGLPLPVVKICESIFESLPFEKAKQFFSEIPQAIECDGKDLSLVHWQFLAQILKELPEVDEKTQQVIDPVIEGMERLASGGEWSAADYAAARAACVYAARAACVYAARAAAARAAAACAYATDYADYAAYAADAADAAAGARAAARSRQRQIILDLIRNAPVVK